jgi:glycosyltransferase involved in cell wall biosynthesis
MLTKIVFAIFICSFVHCTAEHPEQKRKTVCLNMIVKDESAVIRRCLASTKKVIDYWVIVDTGSKDGTQKIISDFLKDIPGELHERPWVDFEHNRNEALALAKNKSDYLLFIDADEELIFSDSFIMPNLDKDFYYGVIKSDDSIWRRIMLVNSRLDWKWEGVIHERPVSFEAKTSDDIKGVLNLVDKKDGYRSQDPRKYHKDVQVLEKAVQKDPTNSRYVFYLAQTYLACNKQFLALKNYEKRSSMQGDAEEVFWSLLMIGELRELMQMPQEVVIESYWKAYYSRVTRGEPLFRLASYYCKIGKYNEGYALAKFGLSMAQPHDSISVLPWVYDYGFLCVLSECAYRLKKYDEAQETLYKILVKPNLKPDIRKQAEKSLKVLKAEKPQSSS